MPITTTPETRLRLMHLGWGYSQPRLEEIQKKAKDLITSYNEEAPHTVEQHDLTMEDGCLLSGVTFKHPDYKKHIVVFPGMGYYPEEWLEVFQALHKVTTSNVHVFSYRGTTHAEGVDPSEEILVQDGVKIIKNLIDQGVTPKDIILYGVSFGGGISLLTAAKLTESDIVVDVINERSFRGFLSAVHHIIPLVGPVLSTILSNSDLWKISSEEALSKLKGKLIVVYHPNDYVIQSEASLKKLLDTKNFPNLKSLSVIEMKDDSSPWLYDNVPCSFLFKAHCRRLNTEELKKLSEALQEKENIL